MKSDLKRLTLASRDLSFSTDNSESSLIVPTTVIANPAQQIPTFRQMLQPNSAVNNSPQKLKTEDAKMENGGKSEKEHTQSKKLSMLKSLGRNKSKSPSSSPRRLFRDSTQNEKGSQNNGDCEQEAFFMQYECFSFCGSETHLENEQDSNNSKDENHLHPTVNGSQDFAFPSPKNSLTKPVRVRVSSGDISKNTLDPFNPLTPINPPPFTSASKNAPHTWVLPSPATAKSAGLDPHTLIFQFDAHENQGSNGSSHFRRSESISPTTTLSSSAVIFDNNESGFFDFDKLIDLTSRANSNMRSRLTTSNSVAMSSTSVPHLEISLSTECDSNTSFDESFNTLQKSSGSNQSQFASGRRLKSPSVSFQTDDGSSFEYDSAPRNATFLSSSGNTRLSTSVSCCNSIYDTSKDEYSANYLSRNLQAFSDNNGFDNQLKTRDHRSFRKVATINLENQSPERNNISDKKSNLNLPRVTGKAQFLNPPEVLSFGSSDQGGGRSSGGHAYLNGGRRANSTNELSTNQHQQDYPPECTLEEMAQRCVDSFG